MVRLELLQPSILNSGSGLDLMLGFDSVVVLLADYESLAGSDSASSAGSTLGTLVGSESTHFATEEWFQPSILQSAKENFQHYVRWLCSVYTLHEGNPCNIL